VLPILTLSSPYDSARRIAQTPYPPPSFSNPYP